MFASVIKCAGIAWEQNLIFLCIARHTLLLHMRLVLSEMSDRQSIPRVEGTFTMQPWIASTKPNSPNMQHFSSSASPSTSPCTCCSSHFPSPFTHSGRVWENHFPTALANLESIGFIDTKDRGISASKRKHTPPLQAPTSFDFSLKSSKTLLSCPWWAVLNENGVGMEHSISATKDTIPWHWHRGFLWQNWTDFQSILYSSISDFVRNCSTEFYQLCQFDWVVFQLQRCQLYSNTLLLVLLTKTVSSSSGNVLRGLQIKRKFCRTNIAVCEWQGGTFTVEHWEHFLAIFAIG